MSTNTWDWLRAAADHLHARPRQGGDPKTPTLMAVALYWARAVGTEWETGKNTTHSQRTAARLLGLQHNAVGRAIGFWVDRGYMKVVERRFNKSLVIDLVLPPSALAVSPPRRGDFPDNDSFVSAALEHSNRVAP